MSGGLTRMVCAETIREGSACKPQNNYSITHMCVLYKTAPTHTAPLAQGPNSKMQPRQTCTMVPGQQARGAQPGLVRGHPGWCCGRVCTGRGPLVASRCSSGAQQRGDSTASTLITLTVKGCSLLSTMSITLKYSSAVSSSNISCRTAHAQHRAKHGGA